MTINAANRKMSAMAWVAAALMLCALPSFAQDEDSDAAPAQQGGHYEARQDDGESETEEAPPEPKPQPVTRRRTVPRVFRARPGGIYAEPNQEAASPGAEEGVSVGGAGQTQGAADKQVGQGSGSSMGSGGGGGSLGGPLGKSPATQTGGGPTGDAPNGPRSFATSMNCEIKDFTNFPAHAGKNLRWSIRKDGCIAIMFTTGRSGQGRFRGLIDPIAQPAPGFTNISRNPGDFDYHNYDAMNGCASSSGGESFADVSFDVKDPTGSAVRNPKTDCYLAPGQKYYINFRNEKVWTDRNGQSKRGQPSCPAAKCGGVFQVQVNSWNDGRSPGIDPENPGDRPGPVPCQPPPPMTAEEKFQWCISQPEKQRVYGANVGVYCRTQLPYISEYSKYPGLDVRGCPLSNSSLPCGGFSPCPP